MAIDHLFNAGHRKIASLVGDTLRKMAGPGTAQGRNRPAERPSVGANPGGIGRHHTDDGTRAIQLRMDVKAGRTPALFTGDYTSIQYARRADGVRCPHPPRIFSIVGFDDLGITHAAGTSAHQHRLRQAPDGPDRNPNAPATDSGRRKGQMDGQPPSQRTSPKAKPSALSAAKVLRSHPMATANHQAEDGG